MSRVVFVGGDVLDGTGTAPGRADVVVEDGRVLAVGSDLDGDEAVDCTGKTLLPGFFDCHVHIMFSGFNLVALLQRPFSYQFYEAAQNLAATLRTGITTVRDACGADLGVKQAVANGLIPGPRMQISVNAISQTGGHNDHWFPSGCAASMLAPHPGCPDAVVDGPDQVRHKVRELIRAGADVIKVCTSGGVGTARDDPRHPHFRDDELEVLVAEATAAERFVMSHAHATEGIKGAIRAGIRSIEHGTYLDDEGIEMMLERGTWLVPTLSGAQGILDNAAAGASYPESVIRKAREAAEIKRQGFRRAVDAGVKVAMGTDCPVTPHGTNLREVALMAEHSAMSPVDAWVATTVSVAALLGVDDELGTLEPGKRADIVVLEGDALDLTDLGARVEQVWQDGVRVV